MKNKFLLVLLLFIFLSFFNCGTNGIDDKYLSIQKISYTNQYSIPIEFTDAKYLLIDMSGDNLAGKSIYIVKMNDLSYNISAYNTGKVVSLNDLSTDYVSTSSKNSYALPIYSTESTYNNFEPATIFNNNPPPFKRKFNSRNETVYHYGEDNINLIEGDTTRDYWVYNNEQWQKQTATLIKKGYFVYVWVSQSVYDDTSVTDADNLVNSSQIESFSRIFDGSSDSDYKDGIYKLVSNVFGVEYGGGDFGDGGIDSDQHISILIYDINNDAPSNFGTVGYFWGKDLYDEEHSNKQEMLYLDSYFFDRYPKMILSVTAHELQHLIEFNMKFIQKNIIASQWYNEMCSLVCEDLLIDKLGLDTTEDTPMKFLSKFNSYYYTTGITNWNEEDTMGEYSATSYTFGSFLSRNYGGALLFNQMLSNDFVDQQSITEALTSLGFEKDFDDVFEEFAEAIVLNDTTLDNLTFPKIDTQINSIDYILKGFNLYKIPQNSAPNQLGPHYLLPEEQVELQSFGVSIHTCDEWKNIKNNISFVLEKPREKIKFYLVVK